MQTIMYACMQTIMYACMQTIMYACMQTIMYVCMQTIMYTWGCRYAIMLGGTDVNVFVHDESKLEVMCEAVRGARCVASFSENMLHTLQSALGYTGPTVLIPQAVDLPHEWPNGEAVTSVCKKRL